MIIRDMAFHGLIDSNIVDLIGENYDKIMHAAYKECTHQSLKFTRRYRKSMTV